MATAKKIVKKKPVTKKATASKSKPVTKKIVSKKPVARKKAPAKKKHIVKRILEFKIQGWISRKSLFIGLGVAVLAVGSFAAYSIWQGASADAGGCRALGRSATTQQKIQYNKCIENQKANAAKKAAEAKAAATAKRIADAKAAEARAAAAKAAAAKAAAAAAAAEAARVAAAKAAEAKAAAAKGWKVLGNILIDELGSENTKIGSATVRVEACKISTTNNKYIVRGKYTVTQASPSNSSWKLNPSTLTLKGSPFGQSVGVTQQLDSEPISISSIMYFYLTPDISTMPGVTGGGSNSSPSAAPSTLMFCP